MPGGVGVFLASGRARCGGGGFRFCWMFCIELWTLMRAVSMGSTTSGGKTGLVSIDPGTGPFHVFSISSILRRTGWSTLAYDSMKVLYSLGATYSVYGVPTFLTMASNTYNDASFL